MKIVGTINEIGDSARPFPYKITYAHTPEELEKGWMTSIDATFKTDKGIGYTVTLFIKDKEMDVDFIVNNGGHGYATIDKGLEHAFRVMATLVALTKEVVNTLWKKHWYKLHTIKFAPAVHGKQGLADAGRMKADQRTKLYKAFIKKALPGAKINGSGLYNDPVKVEIPQGYYK